MPGDRVFLVRRSETSARAEGETALGNFPMPFLADLPVALAAALAHLPGARWYAASPDAPDRPAEDVARAVGEAAGSHPASRGFVARRLDRTAVTGLLLTTALAVTFLGALLLGVLALLVRRVATIQHVDNSVAAWGYDHRSAASTNALHWVTDLGSIQIVVGLAILLVVVDFLRHRNRWSFLFLLVVLVGMEISMLSIKGLVGRLRPTLTPEAATLGPSFPSGHSATAAAFYAAAALIIGRRLSGRWRHLAIAVAVGLAVAVAGSRCCSTSTGSPTSSAASRSAGPGSRSAPSSSAAGCSGRRPRPKSPPTKLRRPRRATARPAHQLSTLRPMSSVGRRRLSPDRRGGTT